MNKGVYLLFISLNKDKKIRIGKLGSCLFPEGYYCYVGSALNNLGKRIERHKSKNKKLKWHIDYFLQHAKIIKVKKIKTTEKIECLLSKKISKFSNSSIKGFGCSDCRCSSHLYYFKAHWELKNLLQIKVNSYVFI